MFFSSCCGMRQEDIIDDLHEQIQNRLPIITPTLIYAARNNWPTIVFMMCLGLRDRLETWFRVRKETVEAATADTNPSFELLSVALWLRHDYLSTLAANHNDDLAAYLASRNAERDAADRSLWHFANWGMDPIFITEARINGLIPHPELPPQIKLPTTDLATLRLHSSLYCGNLTFIARVIRYTIIKHDFPALYDLASTGCWQGILICIVSGNTNKCFTEIFDNFAKSGKSGICTQAKEFWSQLSAAPRSGDFPNRPPLQNIITSAAIPAELRFAYLVFQFNQPEIDCNPEPEYAIVGGRLQRVGTIRHVSRQKAFYSQCINTLLTNCLDQPQPAVLELLCYCSSELLNSLNSETKAAIIPQLRNFYPAIVPAFNTLVPRP